MNLCISATATANRIAFIGMYTKGFEIPDTLYIAAANPAGACPKGLNSQLSQPVSLILCANSTAI